MLAHTATSSTLGRAGEAEPVARMEARHGVPFLAAFGSVIAALRRLGVGRIALGAPYAEATTLQGRALLEVHGVEVVRHGRLENVANIYDETAERAYALARKVDAREAEAVFISGVGLETMSVLEMLEQDLVKPVISSVAALTRAGLRAVKVAEAIRGDGRLLTM